MPATPQRIYIGWARPRRRPPWKGHRGFRMVYRAGGRWRWHANCRVQRPPSGSWSNRSGWTRYKWIGILKVNVAAARLRTEAVIRRLNR